MSSMQARSSQTTIAPEPTVAPAAVIAFQSSGRSSIEAGRDPPAGPDGADDFSVRPAGTPPANPSISSLYDVPIGTSNTPGLTTSPLTPTNLTPAEPFFPADFIQSTPFARMTRTKKKVS